MSAARHPIPTKIIQRTSYVQTVFFFAAKPEIYRRRSVDVSREEKKKTPRFHLGFKTDILDTRRDVRVGGFRPAAFVRTFCSTDVGCRNPISRREFKLIECTVDLFASGGENRNNEFRACNARSRRAGQHDTVWASRAHA